MPKIKKNYLLERIPELLRHESKGKMLDLGCGRGMYSIELHELGFDVVAADLDLTPKNCTICN